jgi:hypothetical protein
MAKQFRMLGAFLVFIGVVALLPNQVSACTTCKENYLSISINHAIYLDYDGDGYEDDVITIFTIHARDINIKWNGMIGVDCNLKLPSGIIYNFHFNDKLGFIYWYSSYNDVNIGRIEQYALIWHNAACEAGLYTFSVSANGIGYDNPASDYAETQFDPPGGTDPGQPEVGFI